MTTIATLAGAGMMYTQQKALLLLFTVMTAMSNVHAYKPTCQECEMYGLTGEGYCCVRCHEREPHPLALLTTSADLVPAHSCKSATGRLSLRKSAVCTPPAALMCVC